MGGDDLGATQGIKKSQIKKLFPTDFTKNRKNQSIWVHISSPQIWSK
jgi:hypothetical protein